MTEADRTLLHSSLDKVVVLELTDGSRLLVQLLVIVDEEPTPDLFCTDVDPATHVPIPNAGRSILLADITHVAAAPEPAASEPK